MPFKYFKDSITVALALHFSFLCSFEVCQSLYGNFDQSRQSDLNNCQALRNSRNCVVYVHEQEVVPPVRVSLHCV